MNKLILRTDSYKVAHWPVYPEGMDGLYSYLESRGGLFSETVAFGYTYYLKKYLTTPITMADVDYAEKRITAHLGSKTVFNRAMWEHIVKDHDGFLPLKIMAPPEGTVVPTRNVLMTIENTCPKCAACVNYVETLMLKVWYPITVATLSREIKKIIASFLERTGDPAGLPFKLHDFGYRGVSSEESAEIGGCAHLVNFMGTDTIIALETAFEYYGEEMAGFSIPATEHSVMSAKGPEGEFAQAERFLKTFAGGPFPAIACVSDTYNLWKLSKEGWGGQFKKMIEAMTDKVLVVRPDSGIPHVIVVQLIETLDESFGHTTNDKGYKVLNHVRVIQGDGVNLEEIKRILDAMEVRGWSADNIAFGMGGALLQQCNRDTLKFAFKASSISINGRISDVYKDPITDTGKRSKRGRLKLLNIDGVLQTVSIDTPGQNELIKVFENGKLLVEPIFSDIRERAALKPVQTLSFL